MDWKKLIIWVIIIFVVLLILGAVSKNRQDDSGIPDSGDSGLVDGEVDGLTGEDLNQLEQDINALEFDDLTGIEQ